jgi:hypothetical protein
MGPKLGASNYSKEPHKMEENMEGKNKRKKRKSEQGCG